jgi:hypothetical protein
MLFLLTILLKNNDGPLGVKTSLKNIQSPMSHIWDTVAGWGLGSEGLFRSQLILLNPHTNITTYFFF